MGDRRPTSPPSIQIHGYSQACSPGRPVLHPSHSLSYASRSPFSAKGPLPMSIPNAKRNSPPPPLPPPSFIADLAIGRDLGWEWGNRSEKDRAITEPVSPRTNVPLNWDRNRIGDGERHFDIPGKRRRESSTVTIKPEPYPEMFENDNDETYGSLQVSRSNFQLHGERPLERQNRQDSSHAYDKALLSKIGGGPRTPTRSTTIGNLEGSPVTMPLRGLQQATKPPQLKSLSLSDRSLSASSESPFNVGSPYSSRWANSPQSAVVSPDLISSVRGVMDARSPTLDSSSIASSAASARGESAFDQRFGRIAAKTQRSDSNLSLAMSTTGSSFGGGAGGFGGFGGGRSSRGSYDHGFFLASEAELGPDSDFPMAETGGGMQHLHLDDPPHPSLSSTFSSPRLRTSVSQLGMSLKRKASSPPRELTHDENRPAPPSQAQQTGAGAIGSCTSGQQQPPPAKRASPIHHQPHPNPSSYSSASSTGLANGSYASSAAFSVGGSSITTASSQDHLSPSGIVNSSELHDPNRTPYINSLTLDPSMRGTEAPSPHMLAAAEAQSTAAAAHKITSDNANRLKQANAPKLQANVHICDCCPKKPKKFETEEELRQHQAEKQYFCQFCHNRFKNKNEAERHQNSLHLRRHSWSCATLDRNYEAAFHSCTSIPLNTNTGGHVPPPQPGTYAPYDICGYCGEQFPNNPAPDWVVRSQHLTNVHKFGECNQSKKFFRADHFRQHLKHSHGGTSGKWTNMLENACMKEEPPLTPEAQGQEQLRLQQQHQAQSAQAHAAQHPPPPPPALSSYQAAQLQSAPVANMMSQSQMRQGPYPAIPPMPPAGSSDLQYPQPIPEEEVKAELA